MCNGHVMSDEGKWHRWRCCWGLGQGRVSVLGHSRQRECATGRWHAGGYTRFHFGIWICGTSHQSTGRRADWRLRAGVAQQNSIWRDRLMPASFNGPNVFEVEDGWVNGFVKRAILGDEGSTFIHRQLSCKQLSYLPQPPFQMSHVGHSNLPFWNFSPFVTVGVGVSVASVKSMAWGTDHLSDFTWFSQEMVFTWYLESILYISCVYIQHTISMLIPVHLGLSFDDLSCWHQCARAKILLAREVLCSRGKYYVRAGILALAENNICTNEPS